MIISQSKVVYFSGEIQTFGPLGSRSLALGHDEPPDYKPILSLDFVARISFKTGLPVHLSPYWWLLPYQLLSPGAEKAWIIWKQPLLRWHLTSSSDRAITLPWHYPARQLLLQRGLTIQGEDKLTFKWERPGNPFPRQRQEVEEQERNMGFFFFCLLFYSSGNKEHFSSEGCLTPDIN